MVKKTLSGVIAGVVAALLVSSGVVDRWFVDSVPDIKVKKDRDELMNISKSVMNDIDVKSVKPISGSRNGIQYNRLHFSSVENFVQSLMCCIGLKDVGELYQYELYDTSMDTRVSTYENSTESVRVFVDESGSVSGCRLSGLDGYQLSQLKGYLSGTKYSFKQVRGGCFIEKPTFA